MQTDQDAQRAGTIQDLRTRIAKSSQKLHSFQGRAGPELVQEWAAGVSGAQQQLKRHAPLTDKTVGPQRGENKAGGIIAVEDRPAHLVISRLETECRHLLQLALQHLHAPDGQSWMQCTTQYEEDLGKLLNSGDEPKILSYLVDFRDTLVALLYQAIALRKVILEHDARAAASAMRSGSQGNATEVYVHKILVELTNMLEVHHAKHQAPPPALKVPIPTLQNKHTDLIQDHERIPIALGALFGVVADMDHAIRVSLTGATTFTMEQEELGGPDGTEPTTRVVEIPGQRLREECTKWFQRATELESELQRAKATRQGQAGASTVGSVAVDALEKRVAQLDGQLATARNRINQLQSDLARAIHDRKDFQNRYKDAQARITHYQQHLQKTEATVESIARLDDVVAQLGRDGALLTSMFRSQAKKFTALEAEAAELRARVAALELEKERAVQSNADALKTVEDRDCALIRLAAARRAALEETATTKRELEQLREENTRLKASLAAPEQE